jgi:hypothetical protein
MIISDLHDRVTPKTYLAWADALKYGKGNTAICFYCHVPQCNDNLHPTFSSLPDACEYPDAITGIGYGIYNIGPWRGHAEHHFKMKWPTECHFLAWLNGKPIPGHKSNLSALFLWYSETR